MRQRFVRDKSRQIKLRPRDYRIMEAVATARYLTNQQLCRLFFEAKSYKKCTVRSRLLYDTGYLAKRERESTKPDVYYLGLRGKRYIATLGQGKEEEIAKIAGVAGTGAESDLFLKHDLALSGLYVNAVLQCRLYSWEMVWRNARVLEMAGWPVQPDAGIVVETGNGSRQAFIEFTDSMPDRGEIDRKLTGYAWLLEELQGKAVILWLTTSSNKANRLRQRIKSGKYVEYFAVGLIEEAHRFLTEKIWQSPCSEDLSSWITPKLEVAYRAVNAVGDR